MHHYFKGGRGKKAPYETIMIRIPLPLKPSVLKLAEDYRREAEAKNHIAELERQGLSTEDIQKLLARLKETGDNDT